MTRFNEDTILSMCTPELRLEFAAKQALEDKEIIEGFKKFAAAAASANRIYKMATLPWQIKLYRKIRKLYKHLVLCLC